MKRDILASAIGVVSLTATMLLTVPVFAGEGRGHGEGHRNRARAVPEIAPAGLVAAGAVLAGGLAFVRSRRRR